MKIITTLIFLIIFIPCSLACKCILFNDIKTLDSASYEISDLIVIGNITEITENNYKIKIKKILKGSVASLEIIGTYVELKGSMSTCAFYPDENGDYLLYLEKTKFSKKQFHASHCFGTRPLNNPTRNINFVEYALDKAKLLTEECIRDLEDRRKK